MKLTRQRRISIAILSLALIALAADRLIFGPTGLGPVPAVAGLPDKEQDVVAPAPSRVKVVSVADRLGALRANAAVTLDGFAPPADWLPPPSPTVTSEKAVAEQAELPTLTSIFPQGPKGVPEAIINKHRVQEGQSVDGWTVVKINTGRAGEQPGVHVRRGRQDATLSLLAASTTARNAIKTTSIAPSTQRAGAAEDR